MPHNDWISLGLYFAFIAALGLPAILMKVLFNLPFEWVRKMYHMVITLSVLPLVFFFNHWYMAVLAVAMLIVIAYPLLALVENTAAYRRIAVERKGGEFKSSLIIVQASIALMLFVFWGWLGEEWKYVIVAAVLAWGFGDAAAALIGKKFGQRRIRHARIEGPKTVEGTQAMYVTAGLAIFLTLLTYAGLPWLTSLAVALLAAPVSAAVELFTNRGLDTLTVPITTGVAVLGLMWLFTFLGV